MQAKAYARSRGVPPSSIFAAIAAGLIHPLPEGGIPWHWAIPPAAFALTITGAYWYAKGKSKAFLQAALISFATIIVWAYLGLANLEDLTPEYISDEEKKPETPQYGVIEDSGFQGHGLIDFGD